MIWSVLLGPDPFLPGRGRQSFGSPCIYCMYHTSMNTIELLTDVLSIYFTQHDVLFSHLVVKKYSTPVFRNKSLRPIIFFRRKVFAPLSMVPARVPGKFWPFLRQFAQKKKSLCSFVIARKERIKLAFALGIFQNVSPCWKPINPGYSEDFNLPVSGFPLAHEISHRERRIRWPWERGCANLSFFVRGTVTIKTFWDK